MSGVPNPLSKSAPWDLVAEGYARFAAGELSPFSAEALTLAGLTSGQQVLDVACGPGTLSLLAAKTAAHVTAIDFSGRMVAEFQTELKKRKIANVEVHQGDGQALPFGDQSFDAAFSMFGLIFFPDRAKGFAELYRTLKPGGKAVVSSWAPLSRSSLMKAMFGALRAMNPEASDPPRAPGILEDPHNFKSEMEKGGFKNVRVVSVTQGFSAASPASFWEAMAAGSVPIVLMRREMGEAAWAAKEKRALAYLQEQWPVISHRLASDAWLGLGVK